MNCKKTILLIAIFLLISEHFVWPTKAATENQEPVNLRTIHEIKIPIGENYIISDGEKIILNTPVYLSDEGATMIPLLIIAKLCSINNISWDSISTSAIIQSGDESSYRTVIFMANENYFVINDEKYNYILGTSELKNEILYVPVRDFAHVFGFDVSWDEVTYVATINEIVTMPDWACLKSR